MSHLYINAVIDLILCVHVSQKCDIVKMTVNHFDLRMDTWHMVC